MAAHESHLDQQGDEAREQLVSRRRWSCFGTACVAALFLVAAVHSHRASTSAAALAASAAAQAPTQHAQQLIHGSFRRAEPEVKPTDYDGMSDVKMDQTAFVEGEQHVLNDLFKHIKVEDTAIKRAFRDARARMARVLQASIEKQETAEKDAAVLEERRKHLVQPESVDDRMRDLYRSVYHSHLLMRNFSRLGDQVRGVEDAVCDGHPCKHWRNVLDKTQTTVSDLETRIKEIRAAQEEDRGNRRRRVRKNSVETHANAHNARKRPR